MANCSDCLFGGDKGTDQAGKGRVFCLVRTNWVPDVARCESYREQAKLDKELIDKLAYEIRLERAENRRLNKILSKNFKYIVITFLISFALFIAAVKFFEKYIF